MGPCVSRHSPRRSAPLNTPGPTIYDAASLTTRTMPLIRRTSQSASLAFATERGLMTYPGLASPGCLPRSPGSASRDVPSREEWYASGLVISPSADRPVRPLKKRRVRWRRVYAAASDTATPTTPPAPIAHEMPSMVHGGAAAASSPTGGADSGRSGDGGGADGGGGGEGGVGGGSAAATGGGGLGSAYG